MSPFDSTTTTLAPTPKARRRPVPAAADEAATDAAAALPNGPAAAAILAAGIGSFALGLFDILGDAFRAMGRFFTFYGPTGPLSGVTTSAILIWLVSWFGLSRLWGKKSVAIARVNAAAFVLLALAILIIFPPVMDLLEGK